ncbi:unnamed protein product [Allacma fusca]|uniref:Uncharacterized protein n=1 Tax=Allacma fusca TaxID=39272 RepID=A0A8J2PWI2_9HEXA|nr:unnamed protein product [Allacma fusca]
MNLLWEVWVPNHSPPLEPPLYILRSHLMQTNPQESTFNYLLKPILLAVISATIIATAPDFSQSERSEEMWDGESLPSATLFYQQVRESRREDTYHLKKRSLDRGRHRKEEWYNRREANPRNGVLKNNGKEKIVILCLIES